MQFPGDYSSEDSDDDENSEDEETDEDPSDKEKDNGSDRPVENNSSIFRYEMTRWWKYSRHKLLSDYVRVDYLLCPHPVVVEHAKKNRDSKDDEAVDRLIEKLFVSHNKLDHSKRISLSAMLLDKFYNELKAFRSKQGVFVLEKIWNLAERDGTKTCEWHYKFSLGNTEVLGKLACIVTSKLCGIGEAEHHWKANKRQLTGQRACLGAHKTKMQASISAAYCHKRSAMRRAAASKAGKLWEDDDLKTCKFDAYCVGDMFPWDKSVTCILGHGVRIGKRLGSRAVDV